MSQTLDAQCERWMDVCDRLLVGESISEEDERFKAEHAASCPLCAAEDRALAALAGTDEPSLSDEDAERLVESVLSATEAKKLPLLSDEGTTEAKKLPLVSDEGAPEAKKLPLARPAPVVELAPRRKALALSAGLAAALAVAAALAIWLGRGEAERHEPFAVLDTLEGDVTVDGTPARAGARLSRGAKLRVGSAGRACLAFDAGHVRSCVGRESELWVENARPSERQLWLAKGVVVSALDKLPEGHHFGVLSARGRARVTGTVFSVSTADERTIVRVHEGSVEVSSPGSQAAALAVGREVDLGLAAERPIRSEDRERELALVGVTLPRHGETAPSAPTAATATTEASSAATAPSASVTPAEPQGQPVKPATAAEMLAKARAARAQGNPKEAAEGYRRLMSVHPKSAEAHAALLSLAELQLGPLGDPGGALKSYDAYLRGGGGAVAQEARYGRILALRRLGRSAEERAAIDEFVKAYPNSVQARALRAKVEGTSEP